MPFEVTDKYRLEYYTGTQASIWIGESWVEEVFGISFQATQNIVPIFGYASHFFDAIARGKTLVQGSFEVNFVDEGYLYYLLTKFDAEKKANLFGTLNDSQAELRGELPDAQSDVVDRIERFQDVATHPGKAAEEEALTVAEIMQVISLKSLAEIDSVQHELQLRRRERNKGREQNSRNIIYKMIPFTLQGIFGNPEFIEDVTEKRIENCFLVSNEMIVSADDMPLKERYSFIGQVHK